jgi:EmrB/QacA subfamily drug resistance transporter
MNQPLTIPLFLPRGTSDQSQPKRWHTVSSVKRPHGLSRISARLASRQAARRQGPVGPVAASALHVAPPSAQSDGGASTPPAAGGTISPQAKSRAIWAIVVTGLALFMASLDNLVVSTALPVIRVRLHAGLSGLEWTVNAYTLTFAVLLLSAAAIGERFGRRRIFVLGIAVFTAASAMAALAPNISVLVLARAIQGAGGAMIMPLSLTLLSAAVTPERRNFALGIWGAIGGGAVALGPLVGGAVTSGWSWQYIFWLNVPVGMVLIPLAWWKLSESRGVASRLDLVGVGLVSAGLFGVVLGLVRGNSHGWTSNSVLASFVVGALALVGFIGWELRSSHPMLDIRLFRHRGFAAVNVTAMLFSFGMFGSIFFLTQFLQTVQGLSPLAAGIRVLPWTAMPMLLAPVVGVLAERRGAKPLVVAGLIFQAVGLLWLAQLTTPTTPYADLVAPFVICGIGMTLFFVPLASLVLGAVPKALEGVASGANSAFRELGGVLGIAVLGSIFSSNGGYGSGQDYVNGMLPAVYAGAAVVAVGAVAAFMIPGRRRNQASVATIPVPLTGPAAETVEVAAPSDQRRQPVEVDCVPV